MPSTPKDFYTSALELSKGEREIDLRNAISRAYYSIFLECRDLAGDPIRSPDDIGSHDACINFYIKNRNGQDDIDRLHMRAGYILRKAKKGRVKADYRTHETCTDADVQLMFHDMNEIKNILNQIVEDSPVEQSNN